MTVPIAALQWYRLQCYAWYRFSAIVSNAVRRSDLNPSNLNDKGAIGRSTATKIRDGKIVTPNSYFKLMKWMEKEKPEVYKEAMEHILKELGKLKMEE